MQPKISVVLIKSKAVDNSSDLNKMAVHLEQILAEKDGVELKVRQGLTEATIKSASVVVFCGYDCSTLSEFFKALAIVESMEVSESPLLFLYEEAGQSIWEKLNYILSDGMNLGRVDSLIFKKVVDTWRYRDIISTIDIILRRLGTRPTADTNSTAKRGATPDATGVRPLEN